MRKNKKFSDLKLLWRIVKTSYVHYFLSTYATYLLICCVVFIIKEPKINNMLDALWYCFAIITTIGFGDITAVTVIGRVLSIILGLGGLFVVAMTTAMVINFYQEKLRITQKESILLFLDKIERLPELSKEELQEISDNVKRIRNNK